MSTDRTIPTADLPAEEQLARYIRHGGTLYTARVSSAQAKGNAKNYSYWGVARYAVALTTDGLPRLVCEERARSDRRSESMAYGDLHAVCLDEGRIHWPAGAGRLSRKDCAALLEAAAIFRGAEAAA